MGAYNITHTVGARCRVLMPARAEAAKARREFARDVGRGLGRRPKSVPSRYFYDEEGNRLFRRIMELPEYYLTECEIEILREHRERIAGHLGRERFNLVELGAGDGTKTRILLEHFVARGFDFRYVPIDICEPAVAQLVETCGRALPAMHTEGLVSEYMDGLRWLSGLDEGRTVVLFLGSNIGNFRALESRLFLRTLRKALNEDDLVLVGFDLQKEIEIMMPAYNDPSGVTAEFNLNLLRRINRELDGDFRLDGFEHYCTYNVRSGAMESYLVSRLAQTVAVRAVSRSFAFAPREPIHTEVSHKYLPLEIAALASETGYEVVDQVSDSRGWFVDSLWRVRKAGGTGSRADS